MQIDPEELKRHYASLSDEALLETNPADLTDVARMYYQGEMTHRKLGPARKADPTDQPAPVEPEAENWTAVGSFQDSSQLADARDVLEQAGIPNTIRSNRYQYELVVPLASREQAEERLREQFFDPAAETDYQNHFALLDDEELLALHTEGLSEVARKYRNQELARRGLEQPEEAAKPKPAADTAFRLVGTFLSMDEASAAQELLVSGNVPCTLANENAQAWNGDGELRLMVPAEFYDRACEILEAGLSPG